MSFGASLTKIVEENRSGLLSAHHSWARVPLALVADILNGYPFSSNYFSKTDGVPLLRIRDVRNTKTEARFDDRFDDTYVVEHGDLVIGMDGDFNSALWAGPRALLNQRVCKLSPLDRFYSRRFLFYAIQGYLDAINDYTSSITVKHLSSKTLAEIPLPLPPRPHQDKVALALDAHFTRIDAAVAGLEHVQANLKRYRASVIKAAVEGRLVPTEAELARRDGRTYEPGSVLLERILKERRRHWEEAELGKLKAKGRTPRDDSWKEEYKEPAKPDVAGLPELPEGWCWARVEQLGVVTGGVTKNSQRRSLGTRMPYLRVANVYANELRLDEVDEIGVAEGELQRVLLRKGDLLVVEGNGSLDQIGRVALWDGSIERCIHQNHIIKARFDPVGVGEWTLVWLLSSEGRGWISRVASSTSGLHTLSLSKVQSLPVPVPPVAEMRRACSEISRHLSNELHVGAQLKHTNRRCNRLRQSILKWAFEGKLVDQDSHDEPASVLLERIRVERASQPTNHTTRRGRRKVTA